MRIFEIRGGIQVPVYQFEEEILDMFSEDVDTIAKKDLDEAQQELARKMVSKGILIRLSKGNELYFKENKHNGIWRI